MVYLLQCSDGSYYTGITNNLKDRLERHSTGRGAKYTKIRMPVKLVLVIPVQNQAKAMLKEKWLKHQNRDIKEKMMAEWSKASPKKG